MTNAISNQIFLHGGRFRHGSELNVTCQIGYALIKPNHLITISQNVVWSVRSKCIPGMLRQFYQTYTIIIAQINDFYSNIIGWDCNLWKTFELFHEVWLGWISLCFFSGSCFSSCICWGLLMQKLLREWLFHLHLLVCIVKKS